MKNNNDKKIPTEELPPIGVVVEALCRCSRDWPKALGGSKVLEEVMEIRRIKVNDNSRGWVWSDKDIRTTMAWNVIWWRFIK
jgi:hypothetical protein